MNKKDIELLEKWKFDIDRDYDYIYIVPTRKKVNDYLWAWYIWKIWDVYKIIDFYDCWSNRDTVWWYNAINFDFEDVFWWIKIWTNFWKLSYWYWWCINVIPN